MAVTADSNVGFKGTVDTAQWAKVAGMGARYAVLSAGALKVTVGGSGDRAVTVSAGEAWGDGVLSAFDTSTNLNGTAVSSGTRWDTLVVRRTWQPALTPTGLAELVILPGSASKAIAASRTTDAGATTSDQPIALLRFAAGSTVVQEVVDLRVWAGQGGGLVADNTDALLYLTDVGTVVDVRSAGTYVRQLDGSGNAEWRLTSTTVEIADAPLIGTYSGQPVIRRFRRAILSPDANGDAVLMSGSDFSGVLGASIYASSTFGMDFTLRLLSGNLVVRSFLSNGDLNKTSYAFTATIDYWK